MQNKIIGVALSALMIAGVAQSHSKFDGGYVGGDLGYKWEKIELKKTDSGFEKTTKPRAVNVALTAGYGEVMDSVYVGGDVRVGYGFGSKKESFTYNATNLNLTTKQRWTAGLGASVGMECMDDCLAFFRLGFDYNNYKLREDSVPVDLNKKFNSWAVVPGVGLKMKVDNDWVISGMYEYSRSFSEKKIVGDLKHKDTGHGVKFGVSYCL
jgi:hypothetical protein